MWLPCGGFSGERSLSGRSLRHPRVIAGSTICSGGWERISRQDLGIVGNLLRRELLGRLEYYEREVLLVDGELAQMGAEFPEAEALLGLYGLGSYSALLLVAETGDPERFSNGGRVGVSAQHANSAWN